MKLGKAFSDSLVTAASTKTRLPKDTSPSWWLGAGRALLFASALFLLLFILVFRLFDLTIIHGYSFRVLAEGNRTRELIRHAPRGILYDRTGKALVENTPQFRWLKPCEDASASDCVVPVTKVEGEALAAGGLPSGEFLEIDYSRRYPVGEELAHVIGYTGELSQKELDDDYYEMRNYSRGDRVGRMGAEAVFEEKLRGRNGRELVEVDAQGKIVRTLGRDEESPGQDITLSFDSTLAQVVENVFPKEFKGAVVVAKPATGEILAVYSSPSFSLNSFSQGLTTQEYSRLVDDPNRPMFNRAIGGVYPPGSTFKIVTALAALEEGAITAATTVEDIGVITIGPFSFPNWFYTKYGKTDGVVDIVKALERSNDIFFYKTGEFVGITKLALWARKVGIGSTLGIEVAGEASGLMPDPTWKNLYFTSPADREARNHLWYLGDTYHVAIGQGYLLTTPLQVNAWTNVIANGGKLCKPTIKKIQNSEFRIQNCKALKINKTTTDLITEGMKRACSPGGTGWPLFNFKIGETEIPVACKTGTAEFGDQDNRTHAWFTVFAPVSIPSRPGLESAVETIQRDTQEITGDPEISVTVLVEAGGEGSDVAAPIAKKILEAWFGR